jgi:TRAP-type C4-dicarboxylate transport system permease small subunit
MQRLGRLLDRGVDAALRTLKWLAIPICLLLFLQWPLREYFRAYSREANDLGQWLFALFIAASVTAATRARTHLATDAVARRYPPRVRRWLSRLGGLVALAPWAVFIIVSASPLILASVAMTRGVLGTDVPPSSFARALAPYLAAQALVLGLTLAFPRLVHLREPEGARSRGGGADLTKEQLDEQTRKVLPSPGFAPPNGQPPLWPD